LHFIDRLLYSITGINEKLFMVKNKNQQPLLMRNTRGFTLIELLIVLALTGLFLALTVPYGMNFYRQRILDEETSKLMNNLKIAQSHSIAGKGNSSWGVVLFEDCYILFMGDYYEDDGRNEDYDKTFNLSPGITIDGFSEIVFEKNTGEPNVVE
jgi:prepilin-type N-terminal cleavage/methylation domain-containing protein